MKLYRKALVYVYVAQTFLHDWLMHDMLRILIIIMIERSYAVYLTSMTSQCTTASKGDNCNGMKGR